MIAVFGHDISWQKTRKNGLDFPAALKSAGFSAEDIIDGR
jgi:hypothetical protein